LPKINLLPENIINKIAAGEVIERPASVVKELVENSLDAEASSIFIRLQEAGQKLIQVTDNGIGMSKEEALLALRRHSTSKISRLEDLFSISTLGFRGEALPSIASVSQMELFTRPAKALAGTKITVVGGKIREVKEIGVREGTTVKVNQLFFNTPARLKFLKSKATELHQVVRLVEKYALVHFDKHFKLEHNGRVLFNLPPSPHYTSRFLNLWGQEFKDELIEVSFTTPGLSLTGLISKISYTYPHRDLQILFVNSRPIKDRLLSQAIAAAYEELLPRGRYPVVILFLNVDKTKLDVNVHPTKQEVRFAEGGKIYQLVKMALRKKLVSTSPEEKLSFSPPSSPSPPELKEALSKFSSLPSSIEPEKKTGWDFFLRGATFQFQQLRRLYIIYATEEELRIVDQHAASERVLYEKIRKEHQARKIIRQSLLLPFNLEVSPAEKEILTAHLSYFLSLGFEIESFGERNFVLRSVPSWLKKQNWSEMIKEMLFSLKEEKEEKKYQEKIWATLACRAAVKEGEILENYEMKQIIEELHQAENPFTCPHGRPTMVRIPFWELEKKLKRR
jgi:DNA mismatch repair protein MutL